MVNTRKQSSIRRAVIVLCVALCAACNEDGERWSAEGYDLPSQTRVRLNVSASDAASPMRACAGFLRSNRRGTWIGEEFETWWTLTPTQRLEVNGVVLMPTDNEGSAFPEHYCAELPSSDRVMVEWRDDALGKRISRELALPAAPDPWLEIDEGGEVLLRWIPQTPPLETIHISIVSIEPPWQPSDGELVAEAPRNTIISGADDGSHPLRMRPETRAMVFRFSLGGGSKQTALFNATKVDSDVRLGRDLKVRLERQAARAASARLRV